LLVFDPEVLMNFPSDVEDEELTEEAVDVIPELEQTGTELVPVPTPAAQRKPAWWRRAVAYSVRRLADSIQFGRGARQRTTPGEGRNLAQEARRRITGRG
jgi:hypothetical protein